VGKYNRNNLFGCVLEMPIFTKAISGIAILFSTVSLLTKFEHTYVSKPINYSEKDAIQVSVSFGEEKKARKAIIPLLLTQYEYIDSEYKIEIQGVLNSIEIKEAYFRMGEKKFDISTRSDKWIVDTSSEILKVTYFGNFEALLNIAKKSSLKPSEEYILFFGTKDIFDAKFCIKFISFKDNKKVLYEEEVSLNYISENFYNNFLIQWFISLT